MIPLNAIKSKQALPFVPYFLKTGSGFVRCRPDISFSVTCLRPQE
jgi:hypothetical protein